MPKRFGIVAAAVLLFGVIASATSVPASANQWPQQIVNGFSTPTGHGSWLAYANGAVTTSGDAQYHGGASGLPLNGPIVGGTVTPTGTGYWLVAQDGGIFTFGQRTSTGAWERASQSTRLLDVIHQDRQGLLACRSRRRRLHFRRREVLWLDRRLAVESADQRHHDEPFR